MIVIDAKDIVVGIIIIIVVGYLWFDQLKWKRNNKDDNS